MHARAVARRGDRQRLQVAVAHHPRAAASASTSVAAAPRAACCRAASAAARGASARSPSRSTSSSASARRCGSRRASRRGRPARRGSSPTRRTRSDRGVEVVGAAGERGRVDRAGRGAGDDRERVVGRRAALAPDARNRVQHADLVGGARAAAGEDQPGQRARSFVRRRMRTAVVRAGTPALDAPRRLGRSAPRRRGRARRSRGRAAVAAAPSGPARRSPCSVATRRDGKSRSTSATGGTLPLTSTRRYLPKRQRAAARSQTCCTFSRRPPEKRSGCTLPCTMISSSSFSRSRFAFSRSSLATASIGSVLSSSLKIATRPRWPLTTRRSLTMPASSCGSRLSMQVGDAALRETPHLVGALVEQMARQVEAERGLLERQPLLDAPRSAATSSGSCVSHVRAPLSSRSRTARPGRRALPASRPSRARGRRWPARARGPGAARRRRRP